ncbi:MAG: 30S ribosomal protein S6 [Gammaproteobacteria bacterium]|nr:30S ribosomal protein S6 [Gammaproteobacteria bacterium]
MRHYEIVLMVHPDHSERVLGMIEQYKATITKDGGKIHRLEDWGRRTLSYPIKKLPKAHYVLMNIECTEPALTELKMDFRYNETILRNLTLSKETAVTKPSPFCKTTPLGNDA